MARHPDAVQPVTRKIIEPGRDASAADVFRGHYRLAELRGQVRKTLEGIDVLMLPTMPVPCTRAEIEADPIGPNSRLGTYTNFVNLLDLAGIAVPIALEPDGTPFGVTLLGHAGQDALLASVGLALHARTRLPLGALGVPQPEPPQLNAGPRPGEFAIAVVGAHLSGMALNHELTALGARFLQATSTADDYRLYALQGGTTPRPGLLRVAEGTGAAIEIETWALPAEAFGRFVASVPAPLSIGTIALNDGTAVQGFLVEAEGTKGAPDISSFGGWRAYVSATQ